jgi:hypothetical protein
MNKTRRRSTAYAQFLGESTEYVLTQLIDTVLAKDKEFLRWRADHPQVCGPRPVAWRRGDAHRAEPTTTMPNGAAGPAARKRTQ